VNTRFQLFNRIAQPRLSPDERVKANVTMLTFLVLGVLDTFDIGNLQLNNQAWALLKIGLGGYVIGRSAEKIVPALKGAMKKNEAKG